MAIKWYDFDEFGFSISKWYSNFIIKQKKNIVGKLNKYYNPNSDILLQIIQVFEEVLRENEDTEQYNDSLVALIQACKHREEYDHEKLRMITKFRDEDQDPIKRYKFP